MADPDYLSVTDEQLRDLILKTGEEQSGVQRGSSSGFFASIFETDAILAQYIWRTAIRPIAGHINPEEAEGAFLQLHAHFAGTPYRAAAKTRGYMTVESIAGGRVVAGDRIAAGNQIFLVDQDTIIDANGSVLVPVTAEVAGNTGNVAPGTEAEFDPEPARLADGTVFLQAKWITFPGHNADDDEDQLRERTRSGYKISGDADIEERYRLVALGINGVSSVAARRAPRGYGTADIVVLFRGEIPTEAQLQLVKAAFDDAGIGGEDTWVRTPTIVTVAVNLRYTGTAGQADVEAAVDRWWRAQIGIGDGVNVDRLYNDSLADVTGITGFDFDSPADSLPERTAAWYQPSVTATRQ